MNTLKDQIKTIAPKLTETQLTEILKLFNSYHDSREHAPIRDKNGAIVAKWCSRHKRYEPIGFFPKNSRAKDGYYSHCRYAEKHLKQVSAQINKLKSKALDVEQSELDGLRKKVAELESVKHQFSDADYPAEAIKELEQLKVD